MGSFSDAEVVIEVLSGNEGNYAYFSNMGLYFTKTNIMNYDGAFYGCNLDQDERTSYRENDNDGNDVGDLIPTGKNMPLCSTMGDYFCSESFGWNDQLEDAPTIQSRDTVKKTPDNKDIPFSSSCCPSE